MPSLRAEMDDHRLACGVDFHLQAFSKRLVGRKIPASISRTAELMPCEASPPSGPFTDHLTGYLQTDSCTVDATLAGRQLRLNNESDISMEYQ